MQGNARYDVGHKVSVLGMTDTVSTHRVGAVLWSVLLSTFIYRVDGSAHWWREQDLRG